MSYHCERCGTHLDDLATQCVCDLPPTKAEIDRARIGHATPIMDAVIAERNRLRADVDARDEVIAEILALLKPKGRDPEDEDRISDFASTIHDTYNGYDGDHAQMKKFRDDTQEALRSSVSELLSRLHARACEIAGRTE